MSETQWPHTLHLSLNLEKLDVLICQTRAFGLGCNCYNSNSIFSSSKIGCSSFYWLVSNGQFFFLGGGKYKSFPLPSFWGCWFQEQKYSSLKPLWALPNTSLWGLSDLWEIQVWVERFLFVSNLSTWALWSNLRGIYYSRRWSLLED
jgi:hypothetical protein